MEHMNALILASQSKGRSDLLREAGFQFTVILADLDESSIHAESPYELVQEFTLAKARAVAAKLTEP
ncbi:MAG TPA: hypothetical protein DEP11_01085, partial [Candidatus Jacksonbacteria bacterium]|nr:hypothetical protein [Candidatus Jacksonbacteria bacterium]